MKNKKAREGKKTGKFPFFPRARVGKKTYFFLSFLGSVTENNMFFSFLP
jgi:hypothetical protein